MGPRGAIISFCSFSATVLGCSKVMVQHIKGTLRLCPPHVTACSGTRPKRLCPLTLAMMMALKLEHAHTHGCSPTLILKARHTQRLGVHHSNKAWL